MGAGETHLDDVLEGKEQRDTRAARQDGAHQVLQERRVHRLHVPSQFHGRSTIMHSDAPANGWPYGPVPGVPLGSARLHPSTVCALPSALPAGAKALASETMHCKAAACKDLYTMAFSSSGRPNFETVLHAFLRLPRSDSVEFPAPTAQN